MTETNPQHIPHAFDPENVPEYIPWSQLDDGHAGVLPVLLNVCGLVALLGPVFVTCFTSEVLVVCITALTCLPFCLVMCALGAIVKATRLSHARQAYTTGLLEHYILNCTNNKQGA